MVCAGDQAEFAKFSRLLLFRRHYYEWRAARFGNQVAVESSLRTAIKLNPSFAPSYDELAVFYRNAARES